MKSHRFFLRILYLFFSVVIIDKHRVTGSEGVSQSYKSVGLSLQLSPELNKLLTQSSKRSMRTKTMEALIRLEDHLKCFPDIAAQNKRFKPDGS